MLASGPENGNGIPQLIVPTVVTSSTGGVTPVPPPPGSGYLITHSGFYFDRSGKQVTNPRDAASWMHQGTAEALAKTWGEGWSPVAAPVHPPLSAALAYLKQFRQFVVWKSVPDPGRPKPKKVPVDYRTRYVGVDPHDSQYWTDYDSAAIAAADWGSEYSVGFVLTRAARVAVIDYDEALQNDGTWHPTVGAIHSRVPGAAIEISHSGAGAHNWCIYQGELPAQDITTVHVGGLKVELFLAKKFIALGNQETARGDAGTDYTAALQQIVAEFFPPGVAAGSGGDKKDWTTGADPEWDGPESDEALIELFLKGSKDKVPTNRQLWEGGAAALTAWKGERGRADSLTFDPTAADMLMAGRLNFWTGNDFERTIALMEMSPYGEMRADKWADGVLRRETVAKAYSEEVYNLKRYDEKRVNEAGFGDAPLPAGVSLATVPGVVRSDEEYERRQRQIAENILIGSGVSSEDCPMSPGVSLEDMLVNFCKIKKGKRVVDFRKPRSVFSFDEWKSSLKQSVTFKKVKGDPYQDQATGGMKQKAYETLEIWNAHPGRKEVETLTFRPGYGDVTIDPQFRSAANTWLPIERKETVGNAQLFINHVEYLFAEDASRFLDWLGHIEQHPGVLATTGWVHVSPHHGTGRNWLASVLTRVWKGYTAPGFDLAETLRTGFNEELSQKLLVIVDEINEGGSNARWDNSEKLKSLITTETRSVNEKYGHKSLEWNCARWLIFSNEKSALPITERDRRFNVVINNKPPLTPEYYEQLFAALRDPGFIASVAWMLHTRDISTFRPGASAVMSEAKRDMVAASKSEAEEIVSYLIENHPADVITNGALSATLNNTPFEGQLNAHQRHALDRAGTTAWGKALKVAGKVVKVRILRNHEFWRAATSGQIQAELTKGAGMPPSPPAAFVVPPPSEAFAKFAAEIIGKGHLITDSPR